MRCGGTVTFYCWARQLLIVAGPLALLVAIDTARVMRSVGKRSALLGVTCWSIFGPVETLGQWPLTGPVPKRPVG